MTQDNQRANYRWVILAINFCICALAYAGLTMWSSASAELVETFRVSKTVASLGSSVFMAGYAIGSFVESHISVKKGYRVAGLLGLAMMVIGVIGVPYATSFSLVLLFRFLQGWGILWVVGTNSSMAWFPPRNRGMASGMIGGALFLGIGSGGLMATGLMNIAGSWQGGFKIFAVILAIAAVIWGILMKNPPKDLYSEEVVEKQNTTEGKKVNPYTSVGAWLCIAAMFFNCWQSSGFSTFANNFIMDNGYTSVQAGLVVLFSGLIGIISTPVGGVISDGLVKKGMTPIKARAVTMAIPGFLVAAVASFLYPHIVTISFGAALFFSLVVGWGIPLTNSSIGALPMDILGDEDAAGKMFGFTVLLGIGAGGILSPYIAQACADAFGYTVGMYVLGAGSILGVIVSLLIPKFKINN